MKNETKFFTPSELHSIIGVDSFRRIAEDIEFPRTVASSIVGSGVWKVSTPVDFIKVDRSKDMVFKDSVGTRILKQKDQKIIGRDQILTAPPSVPENYFMETQTTVGIYPPSTSGVINIPYINFPTSLSSDTTTNELTEKCYMAAVYWTVAECMLRDSDEKYIIYIGRYDKEVQRLRGIYNDLFEESKDMRPSEEYTRR